jgi:hypothetical protein
MTDRLEPSRLDRAELISLLETLGSENDEEVLAAARVLDTKVTAAGTSWSVLLADRGPGPAAENSPSEAEGDAADGPAAAALPADETAKRAETLALIGKLLARSGHSEDLRQELEGYKEDLAAGDDGEFTDSDHAYVRALYKRLAG